MSSKTLALGAKLKYPITISKLLKSPGDAIQKQEAILSYKFKWMRTVGDPFGEEWEEEQTSFATWDSPADGSIKNWLLKEGMEIDKNMDFVLIEETCPHSVQFSGMCAMCGKDMTEMSWANTADDTERAQINMIHDQTALRVSKDEASKAEEELQRRLLKQRKLTLVVDLDQTIIHACIDPTVGEWQKDPSNPNYELVKDVKAFQLNDDGPRGVASKCWYYIKMRPGLKKFLDTIAEMYELHVYTMGTRAYAMNIAKIVDPDKKLFGDRIISRDENGSITSKNLSRLFPVDTKLVAIIDDRADVWPNNRANLIKVVPYEFFQGIGDINGSFLPTRKDGLEKVTPALKKKPTKIDIKDSDSTVTPIPETEEAKVVEKSLEADVSKISALEELVKMGGGDDQALRQEQAIEQEKALEKQLLERPLQHIQEQLDKEDEAEDATTEEQENGVSAHPHHRHSALKDDDVELMYLEQHLSQLHKAFYEDYESALVNVSGGRVAQLKPGHNKKVSIKDPAADLKIVPDVGLVMPKLKAKCLAGCTIVTSGLVPQGADILRYIELISDTSTLPSLTKNQQYDLARMIEYTSKKIDQYRHEISLQATSFGAKIVTKVNKHVTHVVVSPSRLRTQKVQQAAKYPHIKIVTSDWLLISMSKWVKEDEEKYLIDIPESDRVRTDDFNSDAPSPFPDTDDSSGSEDENSIPASQEDVATDDEGVIPDELEAGQSPIDNKKFDWKDLNSEVDEFMAEFGSDDDSGSENGSESGNESDASRASNESGKSKSSKKRKHDETTDEDTDEDSTLIKKQKRAHSRKSGLNTELEDGLPTPVPTGDEDGGEGDAEREVEGEKTAVTEPVTKPADPINSTEEDGEEEEEPDFDADFEAAFEELDRSESEEARSEGDDASPT